MTLDTMETIEAATSVAGTAVQGQAPFTIKRLKALRAPEPKLWGEADTSPVPATLLDWYWHGTPVSNLDSILEHGLLPERTSADKKTCLAARSHVAYFWGRVQTACSRSGEDIALIRIPGSALQTPQLFIEKGTISVNPYGQHRPELQAPWRKRTWEANAWQEFQATFGCIATAQVLRVTPEMVVRVPADGRRSDFQLVLNEMNTGEPPQVDPGLVDAHKRPQAA
jgi:hypothetical protein